MIAVKQNRMDLFFIIVYMQRYKKIISLSADKNMKDTSAFFNTIDEISDTGTNPVLLYSSKKGYSRLYTISRSGKLFILKVLKPEYIGNPIYESLLKKEYEIGYALDHPNICRTYSYEEIENLGHGVVMEWVDGTPLSELIHQESMNSRQIESIISQTCDALSYLHSKQIIHRDLKPSNILITFRGGNVKLIDFGFADSDSYSILKQPAGTKAYASPELLTGKDVDQTTDLWSLGLIIKEMTKLYPWIVRRCTSSDFRLRYKNAGQIKQALNRNKNILKYSIFGFAASAAICLLLFFTLRNNKTTVTSGSSLPSQILQQTRSRILDATTDPHLYDKSFLRALDSIYYSLPAKKDSTLFVRKMLPYIHDEKQAVLVKKLSAK